MSRSQILGFVVGEHERRRRPFSSRMSPARLDDCVADLVKLRERNDVMTELTTKPQSATDVSGATNKKLNEKNNIFF